MLSLIWQSGQGIFRLIDSSFNVVFDLGSCARGGWVGWVGFGQDLNLMIAQATASADQLLITNKLNNLYSGGRPLVMIF